MEQFNEQEQNRRNALTALRELGINPYPAPLYPVNATAAGIAAGFDREAAAQEGFDPTVGSNPSCAAASRSKPAAIPAAVALTG